MLTSIESSWNALPAWLGMFLSPLMQVNNAAAWIGVLAAHSVVCAIVAAICYGLLPAGFRQPRWPVLLLLFCFSFIAPIVGAVGILVITLYALRRVRRQLQYATPTTVELPQYDVQGHDAMRRGQSSIRSRLGLQVPGDIRMQALLTLQAVPGRVANPILEELLGDDVDDVRLLAFGMLDNEEKKISTHIQHERALLTTELSTEHRFDCQRHLAELHWELIYALLAQGELRRHILGQALSYLDGALALPIEPSPGMLFLKGRILLAQGDRDAAQANIELALSMGLAPTSGLPYLAEIAFLQQQYDRVAQVMDQVARLHIAPKTRAIANLWTGRDTVSNINEYAHLPHL
jgi:hypothetical protein